MVAQFCNERYPCGEMKGLLVRHIPVQLIDLSLSGCQFETAQPIRLGAMGELQVTLQGTEYRDAVSVVRAADRRGSHLTAVGGEFTWRGGGSPSMRMGVQTIVPPRPRPS